MSLPAGSFPTFERFSAAEGEDYVRSQGTALPSHPAAKHVQGRTHELRDFWGGGSSCPPLAFMTGHP